MLQIDDSQARRAVLPAVPGLRRLGGVPHTETPLREHAQTPRTVQALRQTALTHRHYIVGHHRCRPLCYGDD